MPYDPYSSDTSPSNTPSGRAEDARVKAAWSDLQRDLDTLGRHLNELRNHSAVLGEHLVNSVQASFDQVKGRALQWQDLTSRQLEELRNSTIRQAGEAQSAYGDVRAKSQEAARQVWERSEPLRQGAKDVGEGLLRAWSEVRVSLGKAAGRLQEDANKASTTSSDKTPGSTV
jgi:hypothetical protein